MNKVTRQFLSCDWGTSSFRLKLIETSSLRALAEIQNNHGISATYSSWKENGTDQNRFLFFASVIKSSIYLLEEQVNSPLSGIPIVLSGMASSSLGMVNLPYKQIPFKADGSDLDVQWVKSSPEFSHDVILISGACSETDVMRGEETQLVGSVHPDSAYEQVYIFPGTHSKHITVKSNNVSGFKTYMTGEIFALLSNSSTLAEAVSKTKRLNDDGVESFRQGVEESLKSNLLHSLFTVRTMFLLQKYPVEVNYNYLSGLLIGTELRDLIHQDFKSITLVSDTISDYYEMALRILKVPGAIRILKDEDVTVRGQFSIVSRHPNTTKLFTP